MAKFHGKVGFIKDQETTPGVHEEVPIEREYTGEVLRDNRSWEKSEGLNDDLKLTNRFSIIANEFAFNNIEFLRYIKWSGVAWKVTGIEIQRPRLILTAGGVYNGLTA